MTLPLILASSSTFRRAQLARLLLPFQVQASHCDESIQIGESAPQLAARLAESKARAVAQTFQAALIIGSDQVAVCDGQFLGKPLSIDKAACMLRQLSGKEVCFYTALVLLNSASGMMHRHTDLTRVKMRILNEAQITAYLAREPDAIYCAGAAKSEGLGMSLIEYIDSTDPNALIGLPIFRLIDFLLLEGVAI